MSGGGRADSGAILFDFDAMFPLRLGLVFLDAPDQVTVRSLLNEWNSPLLPWIVVDEPPLHALLLARGPRLRDPDDVAVFRLSVEAEAWSQMTYGDAMPTISLRKPLRGSDLRTVLEIATSCLVPEHVARLMAHTRPRARAKGLRSKPATLS